MIYAIIPVRGGSKGIPHKNEQTVGGKSLLERCIITALSSMVDEVIVSTDDKKLANIAKKFEVKIHNRSHETSQDISSTESVISEVIKDFGKSWNDEDIVVLMQATSPFTTSELVDECALLAKKGYASFSATRNLAFNWEEKDENWIPINHPVSHRPRRQDMNLQVSETGACYAFQVGAFKKHPYRFCSKPQPVIVENYEGLEIDDFYELGIARDIARRLTPQLKNIAKPKFLVTDFDGCLTDDCVYVDSSGNESIKASRKDGLAVHTLRSLGIETIILSSETNDIMKVRAKKMGVNHLPTSLNKSEELSKFMELHNLETQDIWYCGNDLNDLPIVEKDFMTFCPSDAHPFVASKVKYVLETAGGKGILSEIARLIEAME